MTEGRRVLSVIISVMCDVPSRSQKLKFIQTEIFPITVTDILDIPYFLWPKEDSSSILIIFLMVLLIN